MSIPFIEENDQTLARREHLEALQQLIGNATKNPLLGSVAIVIGSTGVTIFCSGADTICADADGAISATTSPTRIARVFMTPLC